ncbi:OmpA family protein [Capnocytophaga sputigena]|uniref:OmpA family protein n=1 Tax=Capnocytophaga sputigena TaxID=1019 RepID=A0AAX2I8G5_CAPSP|nr:OmpA family protein [Capnocytophaga sputigena]ATA83440.1 OmpA family protein [Capnocytophaga sputigena]EEB64485.1 OmpA family protein [Capnocytophaga sputigena ATCC 33612]SQA74406.1 peptidoglycan-associated outer membrane lipoprotein [Capnocytophaga sputigena]
MKYIYCIIGGLLLCVHSMYAQVVPNKTKTEIVMTVDELQYLLEQIGRAELTNLRDKELDSMLSAVKYKQKEMPYTSAVTEESKFATKSPTIVVGTASNTAVARTATNTAIARTATNTAIARNTAIPRTASTTTSRVMPRTTVAPMAVSQTRSSTTAIAQQVAQLSKSVDQLRKQQQLLLAALAANTGVGIATKNARATTVTPTTASQTPIVVQNVTATGVPMQISAERRSELEQLLAAYGHKKAVLYFANNKSEPLTYDPTTIDEMVTMLKTHPELSILLEGYASEVGSVAYNNVLSMQRAVNVAQILKAKGISSERILTAFKGIDPQVTPAEARRVELRVVIHSY